MPERIQMSRKHPWRTEHPDAVIVARPTKWGNPFKLHRPRHEAWPLMSGERMLVLVPAGWWAAGSRPRGGRYAFASAIEAREAVVDAYRVYVTDSMYRPDLEVAARRELAGKDLACFCPLDQPCHADVLLELSNEGDL